MGNCTKDTFLRYLSERGLTATLQRKIIFDTFLRLDRHVSVDELSFILKAEHPRIAYTTVYRTLKLLAESGIVSELKLGDGFTRFERTKDGERHDHFICSSCHKIIEFRTRAIEQLKDEVVMSYGFRVDTFKLELRGVCGSCLQE